MMVVPRQNAAFTAGRSTADPGLTSFAADMRASVATRDELTPPCRFVAAAAADSRLPAPIAPDPEQKSERRSRALLT